jgi:hypothetical protein
MASKAKSGKSGSRTTSAGGKAAGKGTGGKNRIAKADKSSKVDWSRLLHEKEVEQANIHDDWEIERQRLADIKEDFKEQKQTVNGLASRYFQIGREIKQIMRGEYQPGLFDQKPRNGKAETNGHANGKADAAPAIDEGLKQPLSVLLEFKHPKTGKPLLTKGKLELVKEAAGATIGDLEKFQRENAFDWVQKIKGLGSWSDALNDAHAAFRKKFPMPDQTLTASEKAAKPEAAKPAEETSVQKAEKLGAEAGLTGKGVTPDSIKQGSPEHAAWVKGFDGAKKSAPKPAPMPTKTAQANGKYDGPEYAANRSRANAANPIPTDGMKKAHTAGKEARSYGPKIGCPDLPPDEAKAWEIGYAGKELEGN